jgi:hypothetical protein
MYIQNIISFLFYFFLKPPPPQKKKRFAIPFPPCSLGILMYWKRCCLSKFIIAGSNSFHTQAVTVIPLKSLFLLFLLQGLFHWETSSNSAPPYLKVLINLALPSYQPPLSVQSPGWPWCPRLDCFDLHFPVWSVQYHSFKVISPQPCTLAIAVFCNRHHF